MTLDQEIRFSHSGFVGNDGDSDAEMEETQFSIGRTSSKRMDSTAIIVDESSVSSLVTDI
jgi:hypothetical protein